MATFGNTVSFFNIFRRTTECHRHFHFKILHTIFIHSFYFANSIILCFEIFWGVSVIRTLKRPPMNSIRILFNLLSHSTQYVFECLNVAGKKDLKRMLGSFATVLSMNIIQLYTFNVPNYISLCVHEIVEVGKRDKEKILPITLRRCLHLWAQY